MEDKRIEEKKVIAIDKKMYKIEDGKVVIESDALAHAIQNNSLELFVDEEAAALSEPGLDIGCADIICW
ncbi:MAG: hypothetical protein K0R84_1579 [Clostridia bacterium]|jgi:hypothetical protein|nr:hypothetical protein [Clostridia bacterium]